MLDTSRGENLNSYPKQASKKKLMSDVAEINNFGKLIDSIKRRKCKEHLRLSDDNIERISYKPSSTFKDYVAWNDSPSEELIKLQKDDRNIESKNVIHKRERKREIIESRERKLNEKRKQPVEHKKIVDEAKWWMFLMSKPEKALMMDKSERISRLPQKRKFQKIAKLKKENISKNIDLNLILLAKREKKLKSHLKKLDFSLKFWTKLRKGRIDLMKVMLGLQLKKFMLKTKLQKQQRKVKKQQKPTLSIILINLNYLKLKKKQCKKIIRKEFNNIIGATNEEVKLLNHRLNDVKKLFASYQWREEHLIKLIYLSNKVFNISKNKESVKEDLIDYYLNGIFSMMQVLKMVSDQINVSTIRSARVYKRAYNIVEDTKKFIGYQLEIFSYLRNLLLHVDWTYLYYPRMRIIRKLDDAVKKIECQGYKFKKQSDENSDYVRRDLCNKNIVQ